jgi:protein-disulfide isomerase
MAKAKKKAETAAEVPASGPSPLTLLAIVLIGAAAAGLALFQWMELLVVQAGGEVACAIGEKLNCEGVWSSSFAKTIQSTTGMPVAGWGLVWGLTAFGAALLVVKAALEQKPIAPALHGARLVAGAGVVTSIGLFFVTLNLGVYCLTCIATYLLTLLYAGLVFRLRAERPLQAVGVTPVAGPIAALLVGSYLLLLWPASRTPGEAKVDLGIKKKTDVAGSTTPQKALPPPPPALPAPSPTDALAAFLSDLPSSGRQSVSDALADFRQNPVLAQFPSRNSAGNAAAPVKLVDFSDLRCGHCKHLAETTEALEKEAGPGFSHESRFFPLDGSCNPKVPPTMVDQSGVRCDGAKLLICLETNPAFNAVRNAVFAEQQDITLPRIFQLAKEKAKADEKVLRACMASASTAAKLKEDIEIATAYGINGTPLLLLNGRTAAPVGPFLYAMILAKGDASAIGFNVLPPPSPGGLHEGHQH